MATGRVFAARLMVVILFGLGIGVLASRHLLRPDRQAAMIASFQTWCLPLLNGTPTTLPDAMVTLTITQHDSYLVDPASMIAVQREDRRCSVLDILDHLSPEEQAVVDVAFTDYIVWELKATLLPPHEIALSWDAFSVWQSGRQGADGVAKIVLSRFTPEGEESHTTLQLVMDGPQE